MTEATWGGADHILDIFRNNAERTFIIDATHRKSYTYDEVLHLASAGVTSLRQLGVAVGDRVGLSSPNCIEFAILYFSCLLGGFIAVPLNNALPKKDRAFILDKSRLKVLLYTNEGDAGSSDHEAADNARFSTWLVPAIDGTETRHGARGGGGFCWRVAVGVSGDAGRLIDNNILSMTFTSGTTSLPKAVLHSRESLLLNADSFNRTFGLNGARFLHVMPMAYMAGFLNTLLCPFMAQGSVVLAPQFSARSAIRVWDPVLDFEPSVAWVAPTMLATLTRVDRDIRGQDYCRSGKLRIFSATAPLPSRVQEDFEARYGTRVIESYGLSELLLISANSGPCGQKNGSVGITIPYVTCEVRDEHGAALPAEARGEVYVKTRFRMIGYLDYETGKPVSEQSEWMGTGDVGYIDEQGYLFITGRLKDLVIRGGFNISPRSVEEVLLNHPAVEDAAVFGISHDFYGEELVAAIIPKQDLTTEGTVGDLRDLCRSRLGPAMVPDRFIALKAFPVTASGKVQKHLLRSIANGTD